MPQLMDCLKAVEERKIRRLARFEQRAADLEELLVTQSSLKQHRKNVKPESFTSGEQSFPYVRDVRHSVFLHISYFKTINLISCL